MKHFLTFFLFGAASLFGEQMTGWVTDKPCAEINSFTGAEHKKHIEDGKPAVFVNEADKTVHPIVNPEKVAKFAGDKVTISAQKADDGSIQVESIEAAKTAGVR